MTINPNNVKVNLAAGVLSILCFVVLLAGELALAGDLNNNWSSLILFIGAFYGALTAGAAILLSAASGKTARHTWWFGGYSVVGFVLAAGVTGLVGTFGDGALWHFGAFAFVAGVAGSALAKWSLPEEAAPPVALQPSAIVEGDGPELTRQTNWCGTRVPRPLLVQGTVKFPEGADPKGAQARVRLLDVTYADAPSTTLVEEVVAVFPDGPVQFALRGEVPPADRRYIVAVHVKSNPDPRRGDAYNAIERGDFVSTQSYPVTLSEDKPVTLEVEVFPCAGPATKY